MRYILLVSIPSGHLLSNGKSVRLHAFGLFTTRGRAERYAKLKGHKKYEIVLFSEPDYDEDDS